MVAHLWGWRRAPGQGDSGLAHKRKEPSLPGWRSDRLVFPSRSSRWPWRLVNPAIPLSPCLPIPFEKSLRGRREMFEKWRSGDRIWRAKPNPAQVGPVNHPPRAVATTWGPSVAGKDPTRAPLMFDTAPTRLDTTGERMSCPPTCSNWSLAGAGV